MRSEKGMTLVELLAALALAGIVTVLIASVLTNGTNASQRTGTKQQLQQEANVIVEKIRAHYLLNEKDAAIPEEFSIKVDGNKLFITDDTGVEIQLSEGFEYDLDPAALSSSLTKKTVTIKRTESSFFNLLIRAKGADSNDPKFNVNTSFSKLN
ncbi:prepilin-type N-terminal cleavage/methylation domain-containing protein [Planococcus shenhongbingii]|uniref:prepilin-type N-terminal cleavage/methylation domain-containing protein n=1 Tax=Planococcus shenhongbingii TaxID=3058398 RepID=UPI0026056953|nr:prepilin-type N-terminal cleavage/methylation domain-containing protein [Planococcus sp. N016]WKA59926.1 prepilin-type N-terminal cleavage/methylation domain-containing protein [Planococcus sp. N016]